PKLAAAAEGDALACNAASGAAGGGRGAGARADPAAGIYIIDVESGQLTRVPPAAQNTEAEGRGRGNAAGGPFGQGGSLVFARDGRTLFFRSGPGLYAAAINLHTNEQRGRGQTAGRG